MIGSIIIAISILMAGFFIAWSLVAVSHVMSESNIKAALVANFSKYGFDKDAQMVVVDEERAYFLHNESIYVCDVVDDIPQRDTARPVDVVNAPPEQLKEIMGVVDAMNGVFDDEE